MSDMFSFGLHSTDECCSGQEHLPNTVNVNLIYVFSDPAQIHISYISYICSFLFLF